MSVFYYHLMIIAFLIKGVSCQDIALEHANRYSELKNYTQAVIEYKRFIYFNPDTGIVGEVYYQLSLAYKDQGKLSDAINALRESIYYTYNDSIKDERRIFIAILSISDKKYADAEFELLRVGHFSKYRHLSQRAFFFLGICYLYTFKWDESRAAFNNCFSDQSFKSLEESLFYPSKTIKYRSPKKAKWFSTFIPGSGQIYCGDWRNGINAFILNTLLAYSLFNAIIDLRYLDVFLTNLPFLERYYKGNRDNAEMIASSYNEKNNKRVAKHIIEELKYKIDTGETGRSNLSP